MEWTVKAPDGATLFGAHFLGDWDSCQKLWFFRHRAPHPGGGTGIIPWYKAKPLNVGGAMHDALAHYYASGAGDGQYVLEAGLQGAAEYLVRQRDTFKDKQEETDIAMECQKLLELYDAEWGPNGRRKDYPEMRILVDQKGPVIEREFHLPLGDGFYFTCRVDAIVQYQDWLYVLEHKTTSPGRFSRLLSVMRIDSQGSGECAVLRHHFPDRKIQGVLLNVLVKDASSSPKAKIPRFQRDPISRSEAQLSQFELDVRRKLELIKHRWSLYEQLCKEGMTPWQAAAHCFDMTGTSNGKCYEFRACAYMGLCSNLGKEANLITETTFKPNRFPIQEATKEESE